MLGKLNLFSLLSIGFIGLVIWDCYKSASHFPEGLWYVYRRNPDSYPTEIQTNINQIQSAADQNLEARTAEITEQIRKQVEDSKTGCISFSGLPNAVCFGAKQTVAPYPLAQPQQ